MYQLLWGRYKDQHALQTYFGFYRDYRWKLVWSVILFWIKASPIYVIPIITADIINLITEKPQAGATATLTELLAIALVVILQNVPMHIWYIRVFSSVNRSVERNLRTALCARLQHLSMHYHTSTKMGVLQTKVLRDVENVEALTRMLIDSFPGVIASLAFAIVVTAMRAPLFILFYLALVPVAVTLYMLVRKRMAQQNREFRQSVESMSGHINEMLRLIPVTRAHHLENEELRKIGSKLDQIKSTGFRLDNLNAIFGSVNWTMIMSFNVITLCFAAWLYMKGYMKIGVGDIALLAGYFNSISGAVMSLLNFMPAISKGLESVKSIGEVLECKDIEQNEGKAEVKEVEGAFDFQNVSFRYDAGGEWALREFSLKVRPAEHIALVGSSGAGKSTVAQLVIGFIRPIEGKILLDGIDMDTLDL
ncbi:MAG: ABC transporter ATP-binding protein, partial [Victivallaceae bacterium]|nr:ABC transporter ATP-binding protein [Victivallaceae bacterium]